MLSYKNGKPFCIIRGGKKDGKILKIHDGSNKQDDYMIKDKKLKKFTPHQLSLLKDAMENENNEILDGKLKDTYNKISNKGDLGKHYKIDDGLFKIFPTDDPDQRDSIYIGGPAGSGKSYFCSEFIEEYKKKNPKQPVILFSNKPEDKVLDQWHPMRIPLNKSLVEDPIGLDELEDSLVVFDDIDQITDKDIQKAVWNLRDRILEEGRRYV